MGRTKIHETQKLKKYILEFSDEFNEGRLFCQICTKIVDFTKEKHPNLFHVSCLAHLLHNCAIHVKAHYPNVDYMMGAIKMLTHKNRTRSNLFSFIGTPPSIIVNRWSSWLRAFLYYAENLPVIKDILCNNQMNGILAEKAIIAINEPMLSVDLIYIKYTLKLN